MKLIAALFSYFPYVLAGIQAVEGALGAGNGATKKQLVLNAVKAAAQVSETVPEVHIAGISALIDATVTTLNATNLAGFGTKPPVT